MFSGCVCCESTKVNENPENFTEFIQLIETRDEFAIFLSAFMKNGFDPDRLVSSGF